MTQYITVYKLLNIDCKIGYKARNLLWENARNGSLNKGSSHSRLLNILRFEMKFTNWVVHWQVVECLMFTYFVYPFRPQVFFQWNTVKMYYGKFEKKLPKQKKTEQKYYHREIYKINILSEKTYNPMFVHDNFKCQSAMNR